MTTTRRYALCASGLVVSLVLAFAPQATLAEDERTDVIYMKNGDRVTGEIKEMLQGQLRLDTVSMGIILIKWPDIDHIDSNKYIQTELLDGTRVFGQLPASGETGVMTVRGASGATERVRHEMIARLEPIKMKPSFWEKLDNRLSVGGTYSKASDVLQWSIAASTEYRTRKHKTALSFDSMITSNSGASKMTRRGDLTADYVRYRPNRFFLFGSGSVQTNDELGIDRRFLATIGVGRYLFQRQTSELVAGIGIAGNIETSIGDSLQAGADKSNLEGVIRANWSFFKLHTPKSNIDLVLQYYPGITDTGRDRINANLRMRQELAKDLFWAINIYGSYDSKPPTGALAKEDYGVVTSLEYEF